MPPAPPAPTTRTPSAPNTCPPQIFDAGGPGTAALTSWGVTAPALETKLEGVSAPALETKLEGVSAPAGSAPASGHIPNTDEGDEGP